MQETDIFIIGGGINGAAIASDAAGRGLSVILCEKNDLASGTSSASTKLIHGGLRYLELYELGLVRKALHEREILLKKAPHLITPLEFILPYEKHLRPAWLIRIGLFLYDHLAKISLPRSKKINLNKNINGNGLLPKFKIGFSYYDCLTDDARLTILNAISAKERGALILTHHEFISAEREQNQWKIKVNHLNSEKIFYAKTLINAAGPWVNILQKKINNKKSLSIQLVKGSHIIVPRLFSGDFAYILQNRDHRIVFAIPYHDRFTLIGTTDIAFSDDIDHVKISRGEENYLCSIINQYFKNKISPNDIISSYSGVRCLHNDHAENVSKISRDYKLVLDTENHLPLLTVIGGKITTHRSLAEEAINQLHPFFPNMKSAWTGTAPLPGGDFVNRDFKQFYAQFKKTFSWLPENLLDRYAKNYGTRANIILADIHQLKDLGKEITQGVYEKELEYLIQHEWAETAEDVLWRRTKLGLLLDQDQQQKIETWFENN